MSTISLYLSPQIRAYAKANGLVFTPREIDHINTAASAVAYNDEKGILRFNLEGGSVQTLDAVIGAMSIGLGKQAPEPETDTSTPSLPANATATQRALALNAANRDGQGAARAVEAQALVDQHGSPWDVRSINRTRQALITNLDPALANRLRRQAGVR